MSLRDLFQFPNDNPPVWAQQMIRDVAIIKNYVRAIKNGVDLMDHNIDDVLADIASERTQVDALGALTSGLKAQLATALSSVSIPADVQAKINATFDAVESNKTAIMQSINANTPAAAVAVDQPGPAAAPASAAAAS